MYELVFSRKLVKSPLKSYPARDAANHQGTGAGTSRTLKSGGFGSNWRGYPAAMHRGLRVVS